ISGDLIKDRPHLGHVDTGDSGSVRNSFKGPLERVALNARSQQAHGRSGRLIKTKRGTLHRPQRGIHGFLDLAPRIPQSLELLLRILNVCRTVKPGRDEETDTGDSYQLIKST